MTEIDILNLIWEVDGVLFDTYPAITYAISKSLKEMGFSIALNVIDGLVRQSLEQCVETLSQRLKLDPKLLRNEFAKSYQTISPENQPPFTGARKVCAFIHEHSGLNLIVTHRSIQTTQELLSAHRLIPFFGDIFSVEQGYPRKPDPAIVLAVLKKYMLKPEATLLIGDRDCDIRAGQAAGIRTCLFGCTVLSHPPDYRIGNYIQLLGLLKGAKSDRKTSNYGRDIK
jgi:HAD superfamily hydrolase (TIGR01509 family)